MPSTPSFFIYINRLSDCFSQLTENFDKLIGLQQRYVKGLIAVHTNSGSSLVYLGNYSSMSELKNEIHFKHKNTVKQYDKCSKILEEVENYLKEGKYPCPSCGGKGRKLVSKIIRIDGIPTQITDFEKCNVCGGKGVLLIDTDKNEYKFFLNNYRRSLMNIKNSLEHMIKAI